MFDLNSLRTNEDLENSGVWRELGNGAKLLLARLGNAEFSKMFAELVQPYAETGTKVPVDVQKEVSVKCLARTVLLGWEGIFDGETPLEYSYDNAVRVLTEIKDFRELVLKLAADLDAYKDKKDEELVGNSPSASDGSPSLETN